MYERVIGSTIFVRGGTHFPLRLKAFPFLWETLSVVVGNGLGMGG
ncbi:hypothetical protein [uncultured Bacteroides sp.]|nr:hypothetical protein [uncultured Bacteroides sp.]